MKFKESALPINLEDRIKYLYRSLELLRLYHNKKGEDFHDGKITEKQFRRFQNGWHHARKLLICAEINKCKEKLPAFKDLTKLSLDDRIPIQKLYKEAKNDKTIVVNADDIEAK